MGGFIKMLELTTVYFGNTCHKVAASSLQNFSSLFFPSILCTPPTKVLLFCLTLSFLRMGLPLWLPSSSFPCYLHCSVSVAPSLPLPRLICFSLSLNLRQGSSASHGAHCVGLMCRSSPPRLGPYQPRQTTGPLMKAALLSMLIQHRLQRIGIRLITCHPTRGGT